MTMDNKVCPHDIQQYVYENADEAIRVTIVSGGSAGTEVNLSATKAIVKGATDTAISYTVPAGLKFRLTGVTYGGNATGLFDVVLDGSTYVILRSSGSRPSDTHTAPSSPQVNATKVVKVDVTNNYTKNGTYEVTLHGVLFT